MQKVPRLIEQLNPINYNLSLTIDRQARAFTGLLDLTAIAVNDNQEVKLHCKDLIINSVLVDGKTAKFTLHNDELTISHSDINKGEHLLTINYSGAIADSMHGMYPCYYKHNGQDKELIATQFESHHAREVLPCIDEPEAKATFDLTLCTETNVTVLGNMPIRLQRTENESLITTFETTPRMSSYLLAWVIGELHKKTAFTKSGIEVNVWATPAQPLDSLDFALDIATRSIDFFNEYFGTPYPLSKCDHVALPDFSSGAMENWGLITYREMALLADPAVTSISSKHYIATVITHELSHQWFGNLVTMKWWNDLWLNESFASLVEYNAVDALEPGWNVWLDFASYESIAALRRDSIAGVQSVQTDVNHPDEISTLFDGAIVYAKGARLMKMLQHYIGDQAFQLGLKQYFKKFAYKNTIANDLWEVLSEVSGKDIAALMTPWISQPGYPILYVSKHNNQLQLRQEKLTSYSNERSTVMWPITLNSNHNNMPDIMSDESMTIDLVDNSPVRFNIGNSAHFITSYSDELMLDIIDQIKSGELSIIDRLQILNEQTLLARAGIISSSKLIPLLEAYKDETAEPVWDIISMTIGELKKFVEFDIEAEEKLKQFAKHLASNLYTSLGWTPKPNETESISKLRATIISLMLYADNTEATQEADSYFSNNKLNELNPELRSLIISSVVKNDNDINIVKSLFEVYKETSSSELKQDITLGLSATRDNGAIKYILESTKNTTIIRTQDTARWIAYLSRNKYARQLTWDWVRNNWSWIKTTFGGDKSYDDFPRYMASTLSTNEQLSEYIDFFKPIAEDPALSRVIYIGINEITDRVDSIKRESNSVKETLMSL